VASRAEGTCVAAVSACIAPAFVGGRSVEGCISPVRPNRSIGSTGILRRGWSLKTDDGAAPPNRRAHPEERNPDDYN